MDEHGRGEPSQGGVKERRRRQEVAQVHLPHYAAATSPSPQQTIGVEEINKYVCDRERDERRRRKREVVDVAVVGQNGGVFSGSGQSAVCCRPLQSPAPLSAALEALAAAQHGLVTGLRRAGRWIPADTGTASAPRTGQHGSQSDALIGMRRYNSAVAFFHAK